MHDIIMTINRPTRTTLRIGRKYMTSPSGKRRCKLRSFLCTSIYVIFVNIGQ